MHVVAFGGGIRRTTPMGLGAAVLLSTIANAAPLSRPDTFLARVEALALMETLSADILASRSATRALEVWCAGHAMAEAPKIRAELVPGSPVPVSAEQRKRLAVAADETISYRHVRLLCGTHVLSEADNWYVPSRLAPEMNRLLETTETPFGTAVAALAPTRETFAVTMIWQVLPKDWDMRPPPADRPGAMLEVPHILFEHHAILFDGAHRPFSEVAEHYTRDILSFGPRR